MLREVTLGVDFIERGPASVRVSVDGLGELWTEQSRAGTDCRFGCSWSRPWSTAQLPAGLYKISVVIEDDDGHRIESVQTATIDDIVHVTALQVTGETDSGLLDMEVHVFDSANQFVGCAGNPGLEGVDISDILYTVDAPIVLPNGQLLRGMDVGTRAVRFEVWEDDSAPCPSPVTSFDDLLGASPNRSRKLEATTTADEFRQNDSACYRSRTAVPALSCPCWHAAITASGRKDDIVDYESAVKDGKCFTMSEAATQLEVTPHEIRRLIKSGVLPASGHRGCAVSGPPILSDPRFSRHYAAAASVRVVSRQATGHYEFQVLEGDAQ